MNNPVKIMLADDELLFRKGISFLIQREPDFEVIFEASNGQELVDFLSQTNELPDIILMDLKMPELNGVETTKVIHEKYPDIKIIALTSYNTPSFISNMIDVGACAYIVKNATPEEVVATIREVNKKGFHYNEQVMQVIHNDLIAGKQGKKTVFDNEVFSDKEISVLKLICLQYTTNEIADKLIVSPRTVEGHRTRLFEKTKTKNIAGLVVYALQNNIINMDEISLNN
jgi:DNA-binding NarL/FixJ family response regulator